MQNLEASSSAYAARRVRDPSDGSVKQSPPSGELLATITNADGEFIFESDLSKGRDDLYPKARAVVVGSQIGSTSHLQRKLGLGYNAAAALMERLQAAGVVSAPNAAGKREVLAVGVELDEPGEDDGDGLVVAFETLHQADFDGATNPATIRAAVEACPDEAAILTSAAQGRLKSFIERIERLEEDKAALMADLKEVYAEAKGEGFDTKILRKVVRLLKQDKAKRQEEEALIDLYLSAIGGL